MGHNPVDFWVREPPVDGGEHRSDRSCAKEYFVKSRRILAKINNPIPRSDAGGEQSVPDTAGALVKGGIRCDLPFEFQCRFRATAACLVTSDLAQQRKLRPHRLLLFRVPVSKSTCQFYNLFYYHTDSRNGLERG